MKKLYRRLLLTAFMLLAVVILNSTSRTQYAQNPCEECHNNCEANYELCLIQGSHCEQSRDLCHNSCVLICS